VASPELHPTTPTPGASGTPELWRWSGYGDSWLGEKGKVKIGN
jgi:hypothetical protein